MQSPTLSPDDVVCPALYERGETSVLTRTYVRRCSEIWLVVPQTGPTAESPYKVQFGPGTHTPIEQVPVPMAKAHHAHILVRTVLTNQSRVFFLLILIKASVDDFKTNPIARVFISCVSCKVNP